MGKVINNRTLTVKRMLALPLPIILCNQRDDFDKGIAEAGYQTVLLNLSLANALRDESTSETPVNLTSIIIALLPKGEAIYLTDFEMIFDPKYNLDVMKLFSEISRHNKLIVRWCGRFSADSLIYAEVGYEDYVIFKISEYEISCVI